MNYYNEFDPFAAAWLRELIKEGLIPNGEVDERSIIDVNGKDLKGFTQCHFFTGIGGWSYALELAGWSADRPVWTGSPPCQPFSVAGNKKGQDDERHLWPHFFSLIRECKPATVFGEQVAAAIRTEWFDDLQSDMENEGYATAMAVLPACSVGAPHKRERLFFVANSGNEGLQGSEQYPQDYREDGEGREGAHGTASKLCTSHADPLGNAECDGLNGSEIGRGTGESQEKGWMCEHQGSSAILCRDGKTRQIPTEPALFPLANGISNRVGLLRGAGNAIVPQVAAEVIKAYMSYASQES
jgi:DNA (cytosine-5)-methyltransferase 1